MLENEKKVAELKEEELEDVSGGYSKFGPGVDPNGVYRVTYICPQCEKQCTVHIRPGKKTKHYCGVCGTEL